MAIPFSSRRLHRPPVRGEPVWRLLAGSRSRSAVDAGSCGRDEPSGDGVRSSVRRRRLGLALVHADCRSRSVRSRNPGVCSRVVEDRPRCPQCPHSLPDQEWRADVPRQWRADRNGFPRRACKPRCVAGRGSVRNRKHADLRGAKSHGLARRSRFSRGSAAIDTRLRCDREDQGPRRDRHRAIRSARCRFRVPILRPQSGVAEDPVTGSAHCCLGPYWRDRLGKDELIGYQASKRGGFVSVRCAGDRVILGGSAVAVLEGQLRETCRGPGRRTIGRPLVRG